MSNNIKTRTDLPKDWEKAAKSIQGWEVFITPNGSYKAVQFGNGSSLRRDEVLKVESTDFATREAVQAFLPGRQVCWFNS